MSQETDSDIRFFDLVGNMRAMRRLKPDAVPDDVLRKVLETGTQAPSGMNSQPWKFLVLRDPEARRWFGEHYKAAVLERFGNFQIPDDDDSQVARQGRALLYQAEHMHESPALIVVCGLRDWPFRVAPEDRVGLAPPNYGAVYPCVQNMLLACRALGLGAALTTMHQVFEEEMCAHFEIPEEYGVVVTIPVGYPMGNFGPVRRRPVEEFTFVDRWGSVGNGLTNT